MFQNDYILRMIEEMGRVLSRLINGKDAQLYSLTDKVMLSHTYSDSLDLIQYRLGMMIKEGKISEAEDLLFDEAESIGSEILPIALSFYYTLGLMDDSALEKGGFSRAEILDGINDISKALGVEGLTQL